MITHSFSKEEGFKTYTPEESMQLEYERDKQKAQARAMAIERVNEQSKVFHVECHEEVKTEPKVLYIKRETAESEPQTVECKRVRSY